MDWLAGGDRNELAVERIYAAAAEAIAARGLDRLNIDDIAARVGCSRATLYRHVGGKAAIRDAVLARAVQRVADSVEVSVAQLTGAERVVTAIVAALQAIRTDPVSAALLVRGAGAPVNDALLASPRLADAAAAMGGLAAGDSMGAQWVVRVVLSLLYWPVGDTATESAIVRRFVAPAF